MVVGRATCERDDSHRRAILALDLDANRKRRQKSAECPPSLAAQGALFIEHQSLHAHVGTAAKRDFHGLSRSVEALLTALGAGLSSSGLEAQHAYGGSIFARHARE